jgi:ribosomal protein L14
VVYIGTTVHVLDNCGVFFVKCIRILKSSKKRGDVGDFVIIVVPFRHRKRKYLIKNLYVALIVSKRGLTKRIIGNYIKLKQTNLIVLNDVAKMMGTRIKGAVQKELRYLGLYKLVSKAKRFV